MQLHAFHFWNQCKDEWAFSWKEFQRGSLGGGAGSEASTGWMVGTVGKRRLWGLEWRPRGWQAKVRE